VASADYASFVITKTRDVCFTGSLVEHQLSMVLLSFIFVNVDNSFEEEKRRQDRGQKASNIFAISCRRKDRQKHSIVNKSKGRQK